MSYFTHGLPLPPLMDMSKYDDDAIGHIIISTTTHQFSPNAQPSGIDPIHAPIFGSVGYINDHKIYESTIALPFFRFKRGQKPHLIFDNSTGYTFDLHWHGLNTDGSTDGAQEEVVFGVTTKIGPRLDLQMPKIHNNSGLLWVHAHPMFRSGTFTYTGVYGLLDIVDEHSHQLKKYFKYPDNHLMLAYQDADFASNGSVTPATLYTDACRPCYGVVNGVSCVNWYQQSPSQYDVQLFHKCRRNLVKIDILNGTSSFRFLYVGICDESEKIYPFYLIQSDNGLINPTSKKMIELAPANRVSLLVDLREMPHHQAYVFFYNFDLTEVFAIQPNDNNPNLLQGLVPDLSQSSNPTPNPTPIPDPTMVNPQQNPSPLTYPSIPLIQQISTILRGGNQISPQETGTPYTIKRFLKITLDSNHPKHTRQESHAIKKIRHIVFGENYHDNRKIIKQNNFELGNPLGLNYLSLLNPDYFYNLPDFNDPPSRNFILFGDNVDNANYQGGNPLGSTEYIDGENRVVVDMWNSSELDLDQAMIQYNMHPNNYQPSILPSCLFKIYPTDHNYSNSEMLGNDTLIIQLYSSPVSYGDTTAPLASATIVYPTTNTPLNINQWKTLVNDLFADTDITISQSTVKLNTILSYDWTFYPYKGSFLTKPTVYLKSVMIKTTNISRYYVRLVGPWSLLEFYGKPLGTGMGMSTGCFPGNYDANIQQIYPTYATTDPLTPIMMMTCTDNAEIIISPEQTYIGPLDGFQGDGLMNFSTKVNSSEKWIYHNLDTQDSYPFHFHLTSGFAPASDAMVTSYQSALYSRDTYGLGSQQSIEFYLKFSNYPSSQIGETLLIKNLGYMYHCHYLSHHDMNMMGQYFVYIHRKDYFG